MEHFVQRIPTQRHSYDFSEDLRSLIDACRRAERAVRLADRAQRSRVDVHLQSYARQLRAAAHELEWLLQDLGERPRPETFTDTAVIDWPRLSSLTQGDDRQLLQTLADIEEALVSEYDKILDRPLPRSIRTKLVRQRQGTSHIHRLFG